MNSFTRLAFTSFIISLVLIFDFAPARAHTDTIFPKNSPHFSFGDALGLSPFWKWKTLETEHFRVTFPEDLANIAQKTANALEEAHTLLSPRLHWTPAFRTQVLLVDNTDMANGLTSPALRFGMLFYVTPPDNWSSIAHYDDWLRLLAIHEYTHFLNMDPTTGFIYETLRILLGDVLLPNSLWPSWMLEGLAVYMETVLTQGGRGRSTYYDMILRAAVEQKALNSPQFITLDKVNGPNPYYPGGETAYLFGFELMKEVASQGPGKENNLGEMSIRSSHRVPFFINGNLENITGKDWYAHWNQWVNHTHHKIEKNLNQLRSIPPTPIEKLSQNGYGILGARISPDEKSLAYSQDSLDRRNGLYLKNLNTGITTRLCDKSSGVGIAFTPDSKKIIFSSVNPKSQYYLWSDLKVFDLETRAEYDLTHSLRAKDPDVSPDGRQVVFTITEKETTHIALAPLNEIEKKLVMGPHQILYHSNEFDVVSTPRFSPDGRFVAFSIHPSKELSENLMAASLKNKEARVLLKNGARNRFPTFDKRGSLYFISDLTGVDNVFQLTVNSAESTKSAGTQMTNVSTGLWLPTLSQDALYASVFSIQGWDLGKISLKDLNPLSATQTQAITLPKSDIPLPAASQAPTTQYEVKDYSLFPSLWPRQWAPFLVLEQNGIYAGGEVLGFDAVDRHQYAFQLAYNSEVKEADWLGFYSNRSLGPSISLFAQRFTQNLTRESSDLNFLGPSIPRGKVVSYSRKSIYSSSLSFPFRLTKSSLVPALSFNIEKKTTFYSNSSISPQNSNSVPSADATLSFSNTEGSRLSITSERGRNTLLGSRVYFDGGIQTWKSIFVDTEHFSFGNHHVLVPSIRASMTSRLNTSYTDANVVVTGRKRPELYSLPWNNFAGNSLDELALRGYPNITLLTRAAGIGSLDYRFPLLRIFRGMGTNPFFVENIFGFMFAETAYFPTASLALPSIGGGLRLSMDLLLNLPLVFSVEYHKGFREDFGGTGEYFVSLNLSEFEF